MEAIKVNPNLSLAAKFAQSDLSIINFNANEIGKRLSMFLDIKKDSKHVETAPDCLVISYSLERQMMIDDLMQQLHELLSLSVLFACKSKDGRCMECVAYTKPTLGNMGVIHLYSSAHGCLESFTINVYDSVEKMYDALKKRLDRLASQEDVVFLESRDSFHLIKDFH